jgi:hypothetical protein
MSDPTPRSADPAVAHAPDGPPERMPALFISHGAPPLVDDPLWISQLQVLARATLAVLTDAGWGEVVAAAPGHVDAVRRLVFDGLDTSDVAELARLCGKILDRVHAHPQG